MVVSPLAAYFIPFVHKFGRRPLYVFSVVVQFASCLWQAEVSSGGSPIGAVIFFFEESKFIPTVVGCGATVTQEARCASLEGEHSAKSDTTKGAEAGAVERTVCHIDSSILEKPYTQRMALITKTGGPIIQHFWQPMVVLFTFPAVTYTALTYGGILATFALMTSVQAMYLILLPYSSGAEGVGLMNLPLFVGSVFGFAVGGWLNNRSAMWLAKRNKGIFEAKMCLWLALPSAAVLPAGILMFSLGLARGVNWILLAAG